ncbi:glucose 1-dehydrogenase [Ramlibacter sp. AN1015]|uniref:glucose 1-dehydrogenase n=1 Tax=Ramlibacter sp. AN1015 TaxID=3133428 RepID=UPI0030C5AA32
MTEPVFPPLLQRQRAVVTGASSGIGEAVARGLAAAGASVIVNWRSGQEEAERIVQEITDAGGCAHAVQADISVPEECRRLFARAADLLGGLDLLVANAGIQRDASFADMALEDWRKVLDVNLTGQFLCAQEALRCFRRQGPQPDRSRALGKIIFISSVHQHIPWAGHANYAASKGGLHMLMASLAQEVACEGVRVNAIAPGAIATDINRSAWEGEEARAALLQRIPYARVGAPQDIAQAAVWLGSDLADYVVGTTLVVDGGMSLYPFFREGG